MNRILFDKSEIHDGIVTFDDFRAEHVFNVLHAETGDKLKTGEINGAIGYGEIIEMNGGKITMRLVHEEKSLEPWVDLILAPPRPRALKRLLPQLASLGVGDIYLIGAKKTEKDFWGATLLKEEIYRPLLIDGIMQAGTSYLPRIFLRRSSRKFFLEEMDSALPSRKRIIAHPYKIEGVERPETPAPNGRLVLAVGPEGGWTDDEVELLVSKGFSPYSLGGRILRTDTALIALLARLMDSTAQ